VIDAFIPQEAVYEGFSFYVLFFGKDGVYNDI